MGAGEHSQGRQRSPAVVPMVAASLIWGLLAIVLVLVFGWPFLIIWLVSGGIATFLLYWYDKRQAQRGGGRVPEKVLMILALLGGVLGAWAGMFLLRHKTRHTMFYIVNGIASVLYLSLSMWLLF